MVLFFYDYNKFNILPNKVGSVDLELKLIYFFRGDKIKKVKCARQKDRHNLVLIREDVK